MPSNRDEPIRAWSRRLGAAGAVLVVAVTLTYQSLHDPADEAFALPGPVLYDIGRQVATPDPGARLRAIVTASRWEFADLDGGLIFKRERVRGRIGCVRFAGQATSGTNDLGFGALRLDRTACAAPAALAASFDDVGRVVEHLHGHVLAQISGRRLTLRVPGEDLVLLRRR